MVEQKLLELNAKYPNAIAIFGGAYHVTNIDELVMSLSHVAQTVKFYGWHESIPDAWRRFCHLCSTDPMLVEAYIGTRFNDLCA